MRNLTGGGFEDPLIAADIAGLALLYASGSATPVDAANAYLSRIEGLNGRLNALLFVDPAGVRAAAAASALRWAASTPLSPLDGVPVAIKANIAVSGMPWHAGIAAYKDRVAAEDAACVERLRRAGAIMMGVANMHEAALGATTDNVAFGRCHNPYAHEFTPGGSSGGSAAAVSAGLCVFALGTDTLGSVRIPASYCGVVGHMPSPGRISRDGIIPLSWTLDRVGVLARSAKDALAVMAVLGDDRETTRDADAMSASTIAALDLSHAGVVDRDVARAFDATLQAAAAQGRRIQRINLARYDVDALRRACLFIVEVEGFVEHETGLAADRDGFSLPLQNMLEWGSRQSAPRLAKAYQTLSMARADILADLSPFDAIMTPTTRETAFRFDQPAPAGQSDFTLLANITNLAATAFPLGLGAGGLPLSAQILSRDEGLALRLADRLATPVRPPPPLQAVDPNPQF